MGNVTAPLFVVNSHLPHARRHQHLHHPESNHHDDDSQCSTDNQQNKITSMNPPTPPSRIDIPKRGDLLLVTTKDDDCNVAQITQTDPTMLSSNTNTTRSDDDDGVAILGVHYDDPHPGITTIQKASTDENAHSVVAVTDQGTIQSKYYPTHQDADQHHQKMMVHVDIAQEAARVATLIIQTNHLQQLRYHHPSENMIHLDDKHSINGNAAQQQQVSKHHHENMLIPEEIPFVCNYDDDDDTGLLPKDKDLVDNNKVTRSLSSSLLHLPNAGSFLSPKRVDGVYVLKRTIDADRDGDHDFSTAPATAVIDLAIADAAEAAVLTSFLSKDYDFLHPPDDHPFAATMDLLSDPYQRSHHVDPNRCSRRSSGSARRDNNTVVQIPNNKWNMTTSCQQLNMIQAVVSVANPTKNNRKKKQNLKKKKAKDQPSLSLLSSSSTKNKGEIDTNHSSRSTKKRNAPSKDQSRQYPIITATKRLNENDDYTGSKRRRLLQRCYLCNSPGFAMHGEMWFLGLSDAAAEEGEVDIQQSSDCRDDDDDDEANIDNAIHGDKTDSKNYDHHIGDNISHKRTTSNSISSCATFRDCRGVPNLFVCLSCHPRNGLTVAKPNEVLEDFSWSSPTSFRKEFGAWEQYQFFLGSKVDYQTYLENRMGTP